MPGKRKTLRAKVSRGVARAIRKTGAMVNGGKRLTTRSFLDKSLGAVGFDPLTSSFTAGAAVRAAKAMGIFGDRKRQRTTRQAVPVATTINTSNTTWSEVVGKAVSRAAGSDVVGIKIRGCQPFVTIAQDAASPGLTMGDDVATTSEDDAKAVSFVHLCPHSLNGPLLAQALNYQMFAFRKVRLEYTSETGTSTIGSFSLCYLRDPATIDDGALDIPRTFSEVREIVPSAQIAYRSDRVSLEMTYNGDQLFYCDESDATTQSGLRQCMQGQFRAYASGADLKEGSIAGYINVFYELDLFMPTINSVASGLSKIVRGMSRPDIKLVQDYAAKVRAESEAKKKAIGRARLLEEDGDLHVVTPLGMVPGPRDPDVRSASLSRIKTSR